MKESHLNHPPLSTSPQLKTTLDSVLLKYHKKEFLSSDPIEFVHRFSDPWDQEAIAILGSQLAFGQAPLIRRALGQFLEAISHSCSSPSEWVRSLSTQQGRDKSKRALSDFYYRWHRGEDLIALGQLIGLSWNRHGSVGNHFLSFHSKGEISIERALISFLKEWHQMAAPPSDHFLRFLSSPANKSACKRWCMFLRWVGRKDEIDPGIWLIADQLISEKLLSLSPSQLIIPLDTHIAKVSKKIGLSSRKSSDWKTALDITSQLCVLDEKDPIKYDFALTRIGILNDTEVLRRFSYP